MKNCTLILTTSNCTIIIIIDTSSKLIVNFMVSKPAGAQTLKGNTLPWPPKVIVQLAGCC